LDEFFERESGGGTSQATFSKETVSFFEEGKWQMAAREHEAQAS
jgi:hypothetical protein